MFKINLSDLIFDMGFIVPKCLWVEGVVMRWLIKVRFVVMTVLVLSHI